MKLKGLIAGIAFTLFLGMGTVLHEQPVSAAAWHKGTPKIIRGTWYHHTKHENAYVTYWSNRVGGNELGYSKHYHAYFELPAHGVSEVKYRYLGKHVYQFLGIDMLGKRSTYKAKVAKGYLYSGHVKYSRHRPGRMVSESRPNI